MSADPEFSRIIDIRHIDDKPMTLTPTPEECAALARRFLLVAVHSLSATVTLSRDGACVNARGRITADIVQSCAVSGEDLPATIDEAVNLRFVPATDQPVTETDEEIELTEADCDEIDFTGERFDLGEALAQSLALAIDPFATGPQADAIRASGLLGEENLSPFAALAALKKGG